MLEKLTPIAARRADLAVKRHIDRLAQKQTPPGVTATAIDSGVALTGKHLRRRILQDPQLRNFAQ